ncbi:restriction endonuclease subunit S [Halanaerobacter jeridensis]|uniref:Type I restriction enzyme S subunit n=1 Tax=Halanaerobacter jeridensis TaxID=706427 RepID=A0A938XWV7_9FIRM|nr:restriction endonuclease subunit S [Halanaerobacter jeridensis]MBM7556770.1 type I restriction enzyme S subunit [Halanaerobacter jeridensis]
MSNEVKEGYKEVQLIGETIEVPDKWEVEELNDHIDVLSGSSFESDLFNNEKKGLPLIRIRNLQESNIDTYYSGEYDEKYIITNGDILIGMDGNFYVVKWNSKDALLNQRVCRVEASDDLLDQNYLYYRIQPEIEKIHRITPATTVKHLSVKDVRAIRIPVPPLPEQKKIADILFSVDQAIEKTAQIIAKTKELKQGLMQELLTKGIGYDEFKEVRIGPRVYNLPKNWNVIKLKKITDYISRGRRPNYVEKSPYKIINQACIYWDKIYKENVKFLDEEAWENLNEERKLKNNDVLLNSTGKGTIGRANCFDGEENYTCDGHVTIIRPSKNKLNSRYLKGFIESYEGQKHLERFCIRGSTNQVELSKTELERMYITLPPLEEQKKIANILSSADNKIQKKEEQKEKLKELKKGLMQKLLTGEIRVEV